MEAAIVPRWHYSTWSRLFCRPLNYFASLYRQVQKNMMNMDKMLAMMEIEPAVKVRLGIQHLSRGPCNCFLFSIANCVYGLFQWTYCQPSTYLHDLTHQLSYCHDVGTVQSIQAPDLIVLDLKVILKKLDIFFLSNMPDQAVPGSHMFAHACSLLYIRLSLGKVELVVSNQGHGISYPGIACVCWLFWPQYIQRICSATSFLIVFIAIYYACHHAL